MAETKSHPPLLLNCKMNSRSGKFPVKIAEAMFFLNP
jgi:hypothetical protein